MVHQAVNIIFFSKMYQADSKKLDFFFSLFIGLIALMSFFLFFIVPKIGMPYFKVLQETYHYSYNLFFILNFQMLFWIGNALNENVIYRENLSKEMNFWFILIIGTMMLSMYLLYKLKMLPLSIIVLINTIGIYLSTEAQFFILAKKEIFFKKTRVVNRILLLILSILCFVVL